MTHVKDKRNMQNPYVKDYKEHALLLSLSHNHEGVTLTKGRGDNVTELTNKRLRTVRYAC